MVRFGVVGYTSQRLWGPLDKQGSDLLAPEQQGYSAIGEAYVSLKLSDQVLTAGRFQVNQPEINANDNRMTPITYSGGNLAGEVTGVQYLAAYLNATKPKTDDRFINFVAAADIAGPASEPMVLLGLAGEPQKDLLWRLSSYYVPNVLSSTYADASWLTPLAATYKLRLGAQAMVQTSVGDNLLTGNAFSTWSGGLKADLLSGDATLSLAYQQTGSGSAYQTPYSGWSGYTYMIVKSFNEADMKAWLLGATYDFAGLNVPGLVLNWGRRAQLGRDRCVDRCRTGQLDRVRPDARLPFQVGPMARMGPAFMDSRPRGLCRYGCRCPHTPRYREP